MKLICKSLLIQYFSILTNVANVTQNKNPILKSHNFQTSRLTTFQSGQQQSCSSLLQKLICWGSNLHGEGNVPPTLDNIQVLFVSIGRNQVCALIATNQDDQNRSEDESGAITCWGKQEVGEQSEETRFNPSKVELVRAGDFHTCAKGKVELSCWGENDHGQLEIPKGFQLDVKAFSVRNYSTCVVSETMLQCFGKINQSKELKQETIAGQTLVELGYNHLCHQHNKLECHGDNSLGQLDFPKQEEQLIMSLSTYGNHTCGINQSDMADVKSVCWGANDYGQLDIVKTGESNFVYAITGESHSCFVKGKFYIKCVGSDKLQIPSAIKNYAQYLVAGSKFSCIIRGGILKCYGKYQDRLNNIPGRYLHESEEISAGFNHICATFIELGKSSVQSCWGPKPKDLHFVTPPEDLSVDKSWVNRLIDSGFRLTCTIVYNIFKESVQITICWGTNEHSQTEVPIEVQIPPGAGLLSVGTAHVCAAKENGQLQCWGRNDRGQAQVPPSMAGNIGIIACGYQHTCALSKIHQGECWGQNNKGQTDVPTSLRQVMNKVVAGGEFSCGLQMTNRLVCWGANIVKFKVPVGFKTGAQKLDAGYDHMCVINEKMEAKCWGEDDQGQSSSI